jgi:hypothetical protein
MGICQPIDNSPGVTLNLENAFDPAVQAKIYFELYEHQKIGGAATVTVLQNPKHGVVRLVTEADHLGMGVFDPSAPYYAYFPESGYLGIDSATILVDIGGMTIKEVYYFHAVNHPVGNDGDQAICKTGPYRKISSTLDSNGTITITITSIEYHWGPRSHWVQGQVLPFAPRNAQHLCGK